MNSSYMPVIGQMLDKLFVNSSLVTNGYMNIVNNTDGLNYKIQIISNIDYIWYLLYTYIWYLSCTYIRMGG